MINIIPHDLDSLFFLEALFHMETIIGKIHKY